MFNLTSFDTKQKCQAKTLSIIDKLFTQIADICEENKQIFGEKQKSIYDAFIDNASKIRLAKDFILSKDFIEIILYYEKHVIIHEDKIKKRDEDFFTDKKNRSIYVIEDTEVINFLRELWTNSEEDGGFTENDKNAVWKAVHLIVELMKKWREVN